MTKPIDIVLLLMNPEADHAAALKLAWDSEIEEFWIGLDLATSSYDFQVGSVPALDIEDDEPGTLTFGEFYTIAMRLASGNLTGPEAIKIIEQMAMTAEAREWNYWYRRILLKSLPKHLPMDTIKEELIHLTSN